jgi:hypothetical protein
MVFFILFETEVGHNGDDGLAPRILVLDDCDKDFRKPPFEDAATLFTRTGKPLWSVRQFNICETIGGCRAVSVAPGGRSFVVCENVNRKISSFNTTNGTLCWTLNGGYNAATVSPEGTTYALIGSGTVKGEKVVAISKNGKIINEANLGGFDVALDPERRALWVVGADIKKCDLDLHPILQINPITWCAVSVDISTNGSVWIAEREHQDVASSQDRLLRLAPTGETATVVPLKFSPLCVRVDRANDDVWVTGIKVTQSVWRKLLDRLEKRTGRLPIGSKVRDFLTKGRVAFVTLRFNNEGKQLVALRNGGNALEVDPQDHSVWVAGQSKVLHYSAEGRKMVQFGGVARGQKWMTLVSRLEANQ